MLHVFLKVNLQPNQQARRLIQCRARHHWRSEYCMVEFSHPEISKLSFDKYI